jgi:Hsp70 protein
VHVSKPWRGSLSRHVTGLPLPTAASKPLSQGRTCISCDSQADVCCSSLWQIAKRQAVVNPENTFFSVKRFIGRKMDEIKDESKQVGGNWHVTCSLADQRWCTAAQQRQHRSDADQRG